MNEPLLLCFLSRTIIVLKVFLERQNASWICSISSVYGTQCLEDIYKQWYRFEILGMYAFDYSMDRICVVFDQFSKGSSDFSSELSQ